MKKFYTVLGLSNSDPKSKYVNEFGEEYPKCREEVYFPITAFISSVVNEDEPFINDLDNIPEPAISSLEMLIHDLSQKEYGKK